MDIDEAIRLRLDERRPDVDVDAAWRAFERERRRGADRRGRVTARRAGVIAAVLLLVVGLVGVAVVTGGGADDPLRTGPSAAGPPREPDTWRSLPPGPLSARSGALAVWTGTEMVIVGGTDEPPCPPNAFCVGEDPPLRDGAAYAPATDTWRTIAPSPVALSYASAVWTGDVVLVHAPGTGRSSSRLLAYDPERDEWENRATPPSNADRSLGAPVWTGEVVVFAEGDATGRGHADWSYDPASDEWAELPADPLGCSVGRTMVAVPGALLLLSEPCQDDLRDWPPMYEVARYDLAGGRWRRLPDPDIAAGSSCWIVVGDRVVNPTTGTYEDGRPLGGVLDLATGTWSELAPAGRARSGRGPGVSTGYVGPAGAWVVGGPRLYEPATGTWHAIPGLPGSSEVGSGAAVVWTGQELIVWGGGDMVRLVNLDTGAAYTPPLPPS